MLAKGRIGAIIMAGILMVSWALTWALLGAAASLVGGVGSQGTPVGVLLTSLSPTAILGLAIAGGLIVMGFFLVLTFDVGMVSSWITNLDWSYFGVWGAIRWALCGAAGALLSFASLIPYQYLVAPGLPRLLEPLGELSLGIIGLGIGYLVAFYWLPLPAYDEHALPPIPARTVTIPTQLPTRDWEAIWVVLGGVALLLVGLVLIVATQIFHQSGFNLLLSLSILFWGLGGIALGSSIVIGSRKYSTGNRLVDSWLVIASFTFILLGLVFGVVGIV